MKAKKQTVFQPITLTIETPEERDAFMFIINYSPFCELIPGLDEDEWEKIANALGYTSHSWNCMKEEWEKLMKKAGWEKKE